MLGERPSPAVAKSQLPQVHLDPAGGAGQRVVEVVPEPRYHRFKIGTYIRTPTTDTIVFNIRIYIRTPTTDSIVFNIRI